MSTELIQGLFSDVGIQKQAQDRVRVIAAEAMANAVVRINDLDSVRVVRSVERSSGSIDAGKDSPVQETEGR